MAARKIILSKSCCFLCLSISLNFTFFFYFFSWQFTFSFKTMSWMPFVFEVGRVLQPIKHFGERKHVFFPTDCLNWSGGGGSHEKHLNFGVFWWRCIKSSTHSISMLCPPSLIERSTNFETGCVSVLRETGSDRRELLIYWLSDSEQTKFQKWCVIFRTPKKNTSLILVWPLWVRIPGSIPTKVVNRVVLCTVCV